MALKPIHSDQLSGLPELLLMASASLLGSGFITCMINSMVVGSSLLVGGLILGVLSVVRFQHTNQSVRVVRHTTTHRKS